MGSLPLRVYHKAIMFGSLRLVGRLGFHFCEFWAISERTFVHFSINLRWNVGCISFQNFNTQKVEKATYFIEERKKRRFILQKIVFEYKHSNSK